MTNIEGSEGVPSGEAVVQGSPEETLRFLAALALNKPPDEVGVSDILEAYNNGGFIEWPPALAGAAQALEHQMRHHS